MCSDRLAVPVGGAFPSSLSEAQRAAIDDYQVAYGVRRVTFGVWPTPPLGVNYPPLGGCCRPADHGTDDQPAYLTPEGAPPGLRPRRHQPGRPGSPPPASPNTRPR